MFCKTCGNTLEENTKVCSACGSVQEIPNNPDYSSNEVASQNYTIESKVNDNKGFSIAALILGIVSLFMSFICCIPFVSAGIGLICGIIGIILGVKSLKSSKKVLSIVGMCLSIAAVLISVLVIIFWAVTISSPEFGDSLKKGFEQYNQQQQQ